jgi:hypothetical protein
MAKRIATSRKTPRRRNRLSASDAAAVKASLQAAAAVAGLDPNVPPLSPEMARKLGITIPRTNTRGM